jgi:hypothetical protein
MRQGEFLEAKALGWGLANLIQRDVSCLEILLREGTPIAISN